METGDLMNILNQIESPEHLDAYIQELEQGDGDLSFSDWFSSLPEVTETGSVAMIKRSGIARTYYYQILDGTRHPGRDKVIILCLAAELSLDQTQKGLILAGHNPLYARSKRDAVLIYAIRKKMTLVAANDLLDQFDEQMLA